MPSGKIQARRTYSALRAPVSPPQHQPQPGRGEPQRLAPAPPSLGFLSRAQRSLLAPARDPDGAGFASPPLPRPQDFRLAPLLSRFAFPCSVWPASIPAAPAGGDQAGFPHWKAGNFTCFGPWKEEQDA